MIVSPELVMSGSLAYRKLILGHYSCHVKTVIKMKKRPLKPMSTHQQDKATTYYFLSKKNPKENLQFNIFRRKIFLSQKRKYSVQKLQFFPFLDTDNDAQSRLQNRTFVG